MDLYRLPPGAAAFDLPTLRDPRANSNHGADGQTHRKTVLGEESDDHANDAWSRRNHGAQIDKACSADEDGHAGGLCRTLT